MKFPFPFPVINSDVINEMQDALANTGWLTSGLKVITLEQEIQK